MQATVKTLAPAVFGHLYLANKMTGLPYFNAPWFDETARRLRAVPGVTDVFSPVEADRSTGFDPMTCPEGTPDEARACGFAIRDALAADWSYIAYHSEGLVVGPYWHKSPGTISEIACHQALGLPVWEAEAFFSHAEAGFRAAELFRTDPGYQLPSLVRLLA